MALLQLEPVTKYRKQAFSKLLKDKDKGRFDARDSDYFEMPRSAGQIFTLASLPRKEVYQERQFEDSHLTKFLHEQLLITKFFLTNLGLTSILLSLLDAFMKFSGERKKAVLGLQTAISVGMLVLVLLKYWKGEELREKQLIRRRREHPYLQWFKAIWLEVLVLLMHPNLMLQDAVLHVPQPFSGESLPMQVNQLLEVVMLCRVYLLYDAVISSSVFTSTRASRMCRIYSTKDSGSFGAKSFFNAHPLACLTVLYVSLVVVFSRMLSLAQAKNSNFLAYDDFVWCIIITMGTIGYGDYFPATYLGRIIAFSAAISGIIWASLLILTLSQYLAMNSKESKSHVTLRRLELRALLEKYAQEAVTATASLGGTGLNGLKQRSQRVKLTLRRLKNTVDSHNLNQQIGNLFETLYGNLMEIYLQQQTYAKSLQKLQQQQCRHIQEIGFSFAGEIQDIIRDK